MGKKKEVIDGALAEADTDAQIASPEPQIEGPAVGDVIAVATTTLDGEPLEIEGISVVVDKDYGGAHLYHVKNSRGFSEGKNQYDESEQVLQFVQKNEDGSMTPGLQSEQLVLMLIDRHKKLNRRYPSEQYHAMLTGLNMFLIACRERVNERKARGVMGELKK